MCGESGLVFCCKSVMWDTPGSAAVNFRFCTKQGECVAHCIFTAEPRSAPLSVPMLIYVWCAQSCPTLYDPLDCSPWGFSVHGIFQTRILEWVAISSSRGSAQPRNQTQVSCVSYISWQILYHCTTWEAPKILKWLSSITFDCSCLSPGQAQRKLRWGTEIEGY